MRDLGPDSKFGPGPKSWVLKKKKKKKKKIEEKRCFFPNSLQLIFGVLVNL